MTITKEKLSEDLRAALKNADQQTVGVLRMLIAAINNKEIEKRGRSGNSVLTGEELMQVLLTEEKKRKDAIAIFEQGKRQDLVDKEKEELKIIRRYLPQPLNPEETRLAVEKIIAALRQDQSDLAFGNVMKAVMKELKGKADAKLISELVKEQLAG